MASPVWKRTVSFIIILYFCLLDVEIFFLHLIIRTAV